MWTVSEERLLAEMKKLGMSPDRWITIQEAARRLGMSVAGVTKAVDFLEGTKVCGRWMVKVPCVEFYSKWRAGEVQAPRPPEKPAPPPEQPAPEWTSERHGIEKTGKSWADWDTGEVWVPITQAAQILDRDRYTLCQMAYKGKLRRRWADPHGNEVKLENPKSEIRNRKLTSMFCLTDLDRINAERFDREYRWRAPSHDPERNTDQPCYRSFDDIGPNDQLIGTAEAAAMLGVSVSTVRVLLKRGRLFTWQKVHGHGGSPIFLSHSQVCRYRDNPIRQRRQEQMRKAAERKRRGEDPPKKYNEFKEDHDLVYDLGHSLKRNHGDCYSTRQAARVLGVSLSTIHSMRKDRRLKGYRRGAQAGKKFNLKRWWFFKKDDVHALKNSRHYQKKRASYLAAKRRQMFGEDIDTPRFNDRAASPTGPTSPTRPTRPIPKTHRKPPTDHVPQWVKDIERGPVTPGEDRYIPHDPRNAVFLKTDLQRWRDDTYAYLKELKNMESDPRDKGYYPGHYFNEGHRRIDPES